MKNLLITLVLLVTIAGAGSGCVTDPATPDLTEASDGLTGGTTAELDLTLTGPSDAISNLVDENGDPIDTEPGGGGSSCRLNPRSCCGYFNNRCEKWVQGCQACP